MGVLAIAGLFLIAVGLVSVLLGAFWLELFRYSLPAYPFLGREINQAEIFGMGLAIVGAFLALADVFADGGSGGE